MNRAAILIFVGAQWAAYAQQPRLLAQIDDSRQSVLRNHVPPLARPQFDAGPADPALRLDYVTMVLKPTPAQQADLESLLIAQQDRSSAQFHKWLTPEQFGDRFGLAATDMGKISQWVTAQGLRVEGTARGRNWIAFSGTVGQIERTLHTRIHRFVVDGKEHYANTVDPSVPAALADVVRFFRGLDNFEPEPMSGVNETPVLPDNTSVNGSHYMAPDDFAGIYDIMPLYQGSYYGDGQSIAVLGRTNIDMPGYQTFRSLYELPPTVPVMHLVGNDPGLSSSDLGEAMLDLEWSGAVARNATIIYVYAISINTAAQEAIDKNLAPVITESYGSCELDAGDTLRYLAQQASAQGITWVNSAGDAGAAGCDRHNDRQLASVGPAVTYPASIPEITAVGGTMFNEGAGKYWNATNTTAGASVTGYIPEVAWNENSPSGLFSGGGGASVFYSKPLWQSGPGVPADNARDVPDIALTAASHDGYLTYHNNTSYITAGTSAGTPSFAGVLAILNQYLVKNGQQAAPGLGNINPELYRLAQSYPAAFHDITNGNNDVPCVQSSPDCATGAFGYSAGPGYDLATGLGSVDVNNFVSHWGQNGSASKTTITLPNPAVPFNTKAQAVATVSGVNGAATPTGTVSFLVPGGAPGTPILGSASLPTAGTASATISIDPNQLAVGANTIVAVYSGDNNFDSSTATATITVDPPSNAAAITAKISPDPVYAAGLSAGVPQWSCTITLTEKAGVSATLTSFTYAGTDESSRLSTFFPNGTHIPAQGTLTGGLSVTGLTPPVNRTFTFGGTDANGNAWSQQITVEFITPLDAPSIVVTSSPSTVEANPSADPSCRWMQKLNVSEMGGYNMQLTKFTASGTDLTKQISQYFGTTEIAPYGALQATLCFGGSTPPAATTYLLTAASDSGSTFTYSTNSSYAAAPAAPPTLAVAQSSVALSSASDSGSVSAPVNVQIGGGPANWTASIFPANITTSWLKISPASGSAPGTMTLTATAAGQALGVYRATVIVQATNAVPQFVEIPVSFTVGASPDISIGGVTNGASFQDNYAPGMVLSVFGSGLAPAVQLAGVLPLPLSMQGVSATVNGYAAPLYYVSPTQMNLQIPYETGARSAVVGINNNGKVAFFQFQTTATGPGIFVQDGNLVPVATGKPGDVRTLFMTGEGDVTPALFTGASPSAATPVSQLPQPRLPVTVTVGGIPATTQFIGIPSRLVGTTQINFTIPPNVAPGVQPVVVSSNGVASPPANITVTAQ